MWRQKPEEPQTSRQVPAPDPMQSIVTRNVKTAAPARPVDLPDSHGHIRKGIMVLGEITGTDSLSVDGTVEGVICIPGARVTVGREGRVIAPRTAGSAPCIRAREIVILGSVTGNVEADERVDMRAQASLSGDVSTRRISIEDGAYFRGGIDILRDPAPPEAQVAPGAPALDEAAERNAMLAGA